MTSYNAKVLPEGWKWEGAACAPSGYKGEVRIANIASDETGQLWVFGELVRFKVDRQWLGHYKIADHPLAGLPLQLDSLKVEP